MNALTNPVFALYQPESRYDSTGSRAVRVGSLNEWQVEALKKIVGLESLGHNWNSYGSVPPSAWVIGTAIDFICKVPFDNPPMPRIMPVAGGGIQMEWEKGRRELEVEIHPDTTIEVLQAINGRPLNPDEVSSPAPRAAVERLLTWLSVD